MTMLFLSFSIDPVVITSIAIFFAVTAVAWVMIGRVSGDDKPRAEARLDMMRSRRAKGGSSPEDGKAQSKNAAFTAALEKATMPLADKVTGSEEEMSKLREIMMNAGFRGEKSPIMFKGLQLILAGVGLFFGGVFGLVADGLTQGLVMKLGIGVIVGFMGPKFILGFLAKKRMEKIFLGLPDALDLITVCMQGGLSLPAALARVSRELGTAHPMLATELAIVEREVQMGRSTGDAMRQFAQRFNLEELRSLSSVVGQAEKFGGSITGALKTYAEGLRVKRRQHAEEMAQKAAVKLLFPTLLCIFPGIFVVILGPTAIRLYQVISENPWGS